jgi:hypothetical protein
MLLYNYNGSRDSAVGIATGYGMDSRGVGAGPVLGPTKPPIQRVPVALSPRGVQRPGREADHSPPTSAEIKNTWIYTSILPHTYSRRSA